MQEFGGPFSRSSGAATSALFNVGCRIYFAQHVERRAAGQLAMLISSLVWLEMS